MAFIIWTLKKNSSEANLTLVYILYEFKFPLNIRQFGAWWIHLFKHRKIFAKNKITESKKKERKSVCVLYTVITNAVWLEQFWHLFYEIHLLITANYQISA